MNCTTFKKGDRVIIDTVKGGDVYANTVMADMVGQTHTIRDVTPSGLSETIRITFEECGYVWDSVWLSKADEQTITLTTLEAIVLKSLLCGIGGSSKNTPRGETESIYNKIKGERVSSATFFKSQSAYGLCDGIPSTTYNAFVREASPTKEMTIAELEKALGFSIKVVK